MLLYLFCVCTIQSTFPLQYASKLQWCKFNASLQTEQLGLICDLCYSDHVLVCISFLHLPRLVDPSVEHSFFSGAFEVDSF